MKFKWCEIDKNEVMFHTDDYGTKNDETLILDIFSLADYFKRMNNLSVEKKCHYNGKTCKLQ